MPCYGSTVSAFNHYMNGVTRWVIPIAYAFACIICHALESNVSGDNISGCTRERGDRDDRGTETLSGLGVSLDSLGCPGARCVNAASISAPRGNSNLLGVSYPNRMTTVAGNWPSRMYRTKVRNFLSSGVGLANDGVIN